MPEEVLELANFMALKKHRGRLSSFVTAAVVKELEANDLHPGISFEIDLLMKRIEKLYANNSAVLAPEMRRIMYVNAHCNTSLNNIS